LPPPTPPTADARPVVGRAGPQRPTAHDPLGLVLARYLLTGDESAVEEVVTATRPRLLAVARRIVGEHEAEDAVQTAYLSLVRRRGAPLDAPVLPWLLTAVVRGAYRRRALARRYPALADRLAMVPEEVAAAHAAVPSARRDDRDDRVDRDDELARLRHAVHRLPARYRDVVVLHDLHGVPTAQVALLLDLTEAGVRTRLHRARALVRARVGPRTIAFVLALPFVVAERLRDGSALSAVAFGGVMNVSAVAFTAAVALAVGLVAGRSLLAPRTIPVDERVERVEARVREVEERAAALLTERDRLRGELASAKASTLAASGAAARGAAPTTPTGTPPVDPAPTVSPAKAGGLPAGRLSVPGHDELLAEVDWTAVGKTTLEMAPLLPAFFEAWAKDGKMPASVARVSKLNGELVTAALLAASKMKLSMMEANRAYTHPSMMVNAMAATLEAAGKPLSAVQAEAVRALAVEATGALVTREAGYGPETWALQKLLDETAIKERFFAAAFAELTGEQRDVLTPPAARGRMQADLFSSGLMWAAHAQVVPFADREQLVTRVTGSLTDTLGWSEERRPAVREVVEPWVGEFPAAVLDQPGDPLSALGMLPLPSVIDAAQRQLALLERVARALALDEKGMEGIREVNRVWVPLRKAAK